MIMVAALAAGSGLYAAQHYFARAGSSGVPAQQQLRSVQLITPARELAGFELQLADGGAATPETLRGHWTVVFLGFTHCPDVCPTTLAELAKAQQRWTTLPVASRPRVLFVSVDAERDTPKIVGEYARHFHADTLAATGTASSLANFAQVLGMVYMKVPLENGDYTMDHSATLVVLDPSGRQAGLIRPPLVWSDIAADLSLLAAGSR